MNLTMDVLSKKMGVDDFIQRSEFQYRKSEHFHIVASVTGSPTRQEEEEAFQIHKFDGINPPALTLDEMVLKEKVMIYHNIFI